MGVAGCSPHGDAQACGAGCGGGRGGDMMYVGGGNGSYRTEQAYRYVGYGGDFTNAPRRRDYTCCICATIGLSLLLLALYLLWPRGIDCVTGTSREAVPATQQCRKVRLRAVDMAVGPSMEP